MQSFVDNVLNPGVAATRPFLEAVFGELADLFPSPWLHVGGDEVPAGAWSGSPAAAAYAAERGVAGSHAIGAAFMADIVELVATTTGRQVGVWQEAAESGALRPGDGYVVGWKSAADCRRPGRRRARRRAVAGRARTTSTWPPTPTGTSPGTSWAGHRRLADVEAFEPRPGGRGRAGRPRSASRHACGPSTPPTARRSNACCSPPRRHRRRGLADAVLTPAAALRTIRRCSVRRVVTGHDADGKAVVASDTRVDGFRPALAPGIGVPPAVGCRRGAALPRRRRRAGHDAYFPPSAASASGCSPCRRTPCDPAAAGDVDAALAEFEEAARAAGAHGARRARHAHDGDDRLRGRARRRDLAGARRRRRGPPAARRHRRPERHPPRLAQPRRHDGAARRVPRRRPPRPASADAEPSQAAEEAVLRRVATISVPAAPWSLSVEHGERSPHRASRVDRRAAASRKKSGLVSAGESRASSAVIAATSSSGIAPRRGRSRPITSWS